jgi:hypothetical protein
MTVRSPLRVPALAAVMLVLAACAPPAPATPSATVPAHSASDPAAVPTPTPTPAVATVPPFRPTARPSGVPAEESLPTSASTERHGIKLTIRLGNNPVNAGNGTVAFVTLENTGNRLLRWTNDGCDTNAGIIAIMPATWRESAVELPPELAPYRDWLREEARAGEEIWLRFAKASHLRYRSIGCADLGIGRELAPGRKVTQEFTWDGDAAPRLGIPPTGPVTLTSRFERWSRPGPGRDGDPIEVSLDSWVLNGRPEDYLSPAEAIDAALADERLASWLLTQPLRNGNAIAEYDRDLGLWAVGLLISRDDGDPILHAAFLDPVTGEVIAVREHRVEF